MKYSVLLPNIFDHPFTYESEMDLKVGNYVKVPFGKSNMTGIIWHKKRFQIKKNIF